MRFMRLDTLAGNLRLSKVQRWMQACILTSGPAEEAIASPGATAEFSNLEARALILPSRTLTALDRLDIYRGMYELRLIGALRIDYPGLVRLLGEEMFEELARLYVAAHPSESYTLNRLGDRFPDYIGRIEGLPRPRFAQALARLELAETVVFDEEPSVAADASSIANMDEDQWRQLNLRPIRALRLLRLDYPAQLFMNAVRSGADDLPVVRPKRTNLLVYRRDFAVMHLSVSAPAFALFQALAEGRNLGDAMEAMSGAGRVKEQELFEWFRVWFSEGLFCEVGPGQ